jgi:hypothetical protein
MLLPEISDRSMAKSVREVLDLIDTALPSQRVDEPIEFERAWAKRPWIMEEETDKDRAWRWWQARAALSRS